jgi:hypothetical protein
MMRRVRRSVKEIARDQHRCAASTITVSSGAAPGKDNAVVAVYSQREAAFRSKTYV